MAKKIQAINAYRPKIKLGKLVSTDELIERIVERTGTTEGEMSIVLKELRDAVLYFNSLGRGVKIEGLGTYTPKIGLDGILNVSHRLDSYLKKRMNDTDRFRGDIANAENIGKTGDDLVVNWNEDNPDDPVT